MDKTSNEDSDDPDEGDTKTVVEDDVLDEEVIDDGEEDNADQEVEEEGSQKEKEDAKPKKGAAADPLAGLTKQQRDFIELSNLGYTRDQIVQLAAAGAEAIEQAQRAAKGGGKDNKNEGGDGDDAIPVTRGELAAFQQKVDQALRQSGELTKNYMTKVNTDAAVEALLDSEDDTAADPQVRQFVERNMRALIKNGQPPKAAFRAALKGFRDWEGKRTREKMKKKVKANKSNDTSSGAGGGFDMEPPKDLEHKEDDFDTGAAIDQAVNYARQHGDPRLSRQVPNS